MDYLINILIGVLASIIAASIFWYFSYFRSSVKIVFSPAIEKYKNLGEYPGINRYRVRIKNIGKRDLLEISMQVRLISNGNYIQLGIGNVNSIPIIAGKKKLKKYGQDIFSQTLTIFPVEATYNQLKKSIYKKELRQKAAARNLSLDDIFEELINFRIEVYVFGFNSVTGVRKMYYKSYNPEEITIGDFPIDKSKMEISVVSDIA